VSPEIGLTIYLLVIMIVGGIIGAWWTRPKVSVQRSRRLAVLDLVVPAPRVEDQRWDGCMAETLGDVRKGAVIDACNNYLSGDGDDTRAPLPHYPVGALAWLIAWEDSNGVPTGELDWRPAAMYLEDQWRPGTFVRTY
jgi:hypothetical protein